MTSSARQDIRLIASDLDGTLLGSDHRISQTTNEVLLGARQAGIKVVVATGREPFAAVPVIDGHDVFDMAVCSNGAAIVDLPSNEVVERIEFTSADAGAIVNQIRKQIPGTSFAWSSAMGFGYELPFEPQAPFLIETVTPYASKIALDTSPSVAKLFVAHPDITFDDLASRVRAAISVDAEVASGGSPFVAVTAPSVTKANALARLCANWSIDAANVVAFGDSWNDLNMLRWAGLGVAMSNAATTVKDAADDVAGSNDDDGVATYLRTLLD